ncbi:ArsR/SmtB family transcription factor [Enterococcus diestrammenae]|uniref:ArsR family transcriptional regulator n=1 Tax=Enterococcus diestrammenae TaxID=1155073 RepID=A0ABV0F1H9_9ENTE|nr:ArsR family transcriptional regulator [Enterococcus diestrammenae]KAF1294707.1 transcriptional regulator [Enterococcus diestrammenae]HIX70661.1 helix-turn-helix domain-containing protein [Candidatus Enterococcus stercoravium]
MQLDITDDSLKVYEALASNVRIRIIQLLSKNKMSIKELAQALGLSSAIVTMHIRKLEEANIIKTEKVGQSKISSLKVDHIDINFPEKIFNAFDVQENDIPIGLYTDYHVEPTCGLATVADFVGPVDEPKYFMDPQRMDAQILWFTKGFVEYQTPNYLSKDSKLEMMEISLEISSEFPFANDNWPSDITFTLNGIELGTWTSPGDFADIRGRLNPDWYPDNLNQYGLLKTIRILNHGTYMEGDPLSVVTINDFAADADMWRLRIEVKEDAANVGGCTLFGQGFGNYEQDIKLKSYYS